MKEKAKENIISFGAAFFILLGMSAFAIMNLLISAGILDDVKI